MNPRTSVIREKPSNKRADDHRHSHDHAEDPVDLSAFPRGIEIGDDDEGERENTARADALNRPKDDELVHAVAEERQPTAGAGKTAERRPEQERAHREELQDLPAHDICKLSIDRHENRHHEGVDHARPGVAVEPSEIVDDAGH